MDEEKAVSVEETGETPVLVSLGDPNVPVCEDGSCAL